MHSYINERLVKNFSRVMTFDIVHDDLKINYGIKNIANYESLCFLAQTLLEDYQERRANYKSYIERGMDARMLMELRKSAVLPMSKTMFNFYSSHSKCNTVQDVKNLRIQKLRYLNPDYKDLDWQYYMLAKHFLGRNAKQFLIDFEGCYADGDWRKETNPDIYRKHFLEQHIAPDRLKWMV